jgi:Ca-activated chloride channel family protein
MRSLILTLEDADQLELISFGDRPHRWKRGATPATPDARREALAWVERLHAEGGTEMRSGILEALKPLRPGAQRQVVLITDGLIGFESEIVATLQENLPPGCRLHTVGVGSSVNRSLTGPAARAGHGVEVIIDLDGDVAEATRTLLARTCAPLVTDLVLDGDALEEHAPAKLPDLFAGAPALLSLRLRPGGGALRLRGTTAEGPWSEEVQVPALEPGEGPPSLVALFGRERVEDLETLRATGRDAHRLDQEIERTGLDFQIATRLTSWVAITEERTVDPEAKKRDESVPQELPYGMNAEALGLRAPGAAPLRTADDETEAGALAPSDGGVLFSLKELLSLEDARIAEEAAAPRTETRRIGLRSEVSAPRAKEDRSTLAGGYFPSAPPPQAPLSHAAPTMPPAKRGRSGWSILLVLLLIAALVYWFLLRR